MKFHPLKGQLNYSNFRNLTSKFHWLWNTRHIGRALRRGLKYFRYDILWDLTRLWNRLEYSRSLEYNRIKKRRDIIMYKHTVKGLV